MERNSVPQEAPPADPVADPREGWRLQSDRGPFSRAWQLAVLRYAKVPKAVGVYKSSSVSGQAMKAVLKVIDDHAGERRGWTMTIQAIADEAGFDSRGHGSRTIAALRKLGLLAVVPRRRGTGKISSRYEISWLNLAELVPAERRQRLPQSYRSSDASTGGIGTDPTPPEDTSTPPEDAPDASSGGVHHMSAQFSAPDEAPPPDWLAAGGALRKVGVREWANLAEQLPQRGITPQRVLNEVDAYLGADFDCEPGLLVRRLKQCDPDSAADPPALYWRRNRKPPRDKLAGLKQESERREVRQ